ncbi:hypothetical protein L798_08375 [Zootermopsis nevadensis]|uniref:Uncharacterized protein n=1 Tax=Zootermopsis nevadensis TaxID=136037 RepID=A0A067RE09_ZOONE|nr:hypothetical protein L798_08375 [Zootermopsis nevadensis]
MKVVTRTDSSVHLLHQDNQPLYHISFLQISNGCFPLSTVVQDKRREKSSLGDDFHLKYNGFFGSKVNRNTSTTWHDRADYMRYFLFRTTSN